jgi:prepilin-type N-terminal cleavage/methylation domain-containing protein
MRGRLRRAWSDERGFTLVELLVSLSIMLVVFGGVMMAFSIFQRDTSNASARSNAVAQARLGADRMVGAMRNIASTKTSPTLIERAKSYDLVFQTVGTPSGSNVTGVQRVRYCVPDDTSAGSPGQERLVAQTQTWTTATPPANPWPAATATIVCPDASAPAVTLANYVTNRYKQRTDRPVFVYNGGAAPASLGEITSVGIDLFVNPTTTLAAAESEVQSAAFLRNQNRGPLAAFTYSAPGGAHVLLNGSATTDPDGQKLTFSWACTPTACTGAGSTQQIFDWKPSTGAGTYSVTLTATDSGGLTSSMTQSVVVI